MSRFFVSWSGGKDCNLACYRAIANGLKIHCLANMITDDGKHSRTHGLSSKILQMQSEAIGIPLVQRRTTWNSYESEFKNMIRTFKQEGIDGGVFGDMDIEEHRQWVERVCQEMDIVPYLPLWQENQDKILRDFIDSGFEAIVIATRADLLGEEWLGRRIDLDFIDRIVELGKTSDITPCGEAGEYHTLVIDGPLFKKRMEIIETRKVLKEKHWFLEILDLDLRHK